MTDGHLGLEWVRIVWRNQWKISQQAVGLLGDPFLDLDEPVHLKMVCLRRKRKSAKRSMVLSAM